MEELNEMQQNVGNDQPQPIVEQAAPAADDNNSNTINPTPAPEPVAETAPENPQSTADATDASDNKAEETPETEPEVDYSALSREELLAALNELMNEDVSKIRNRVSAIRNQFNTLNKEVERQAFEAFLADGGNKDEYQYKNDAVADAFFKAYDIYRTRRQKMQEEMEAQKKI